MPVVDVPLAQQANPHFSRMVKAKSVKTVLNKAKQRAQFIIFYRLLSQFGAPIFASSNESKSIAKNCNWHLSIEIFLDSPHHIRITNHDMLPLQGSILTAVAAAAPLASILLATSSRFLIVADAAESTKINSIVDEIATSIDINNKSERKLFEIASPFDFFNDQCARACSSQEEHGETNDEELFANPCPKVSDESIGLSFRIL